MVSDSQKLGVLYVDDEAQALKYFSKLFSEDFRLYTAESVEVAKGILAAESANIAIVVTDQRMPGETGVKLLEHLRANYPKIIRIITTAFADLESAIAAVNSGGVYQYITKPWKLDDFRSSLLRALDYYEVRAQRDALLDQKLSVLQGVLVLDRIRSLAAIAASFEGRLQRPLTALKAYVDQARNIEMQAFGRDELLSLDLWAVARGEGQFLVQAVRNLQKCLSFLGDEPASRSAFELTRSAVQEVLADKKDAGVAIHVRDESSGQVIHCQPRAILQIVRLLLNRVTDMDGEDIDIDVVVRAKDDDQVAIDILPRKRNWNPRQLASLFSGAISKKHWLMGLDMDLLATFLIAYDQGGELQISRAQEPAAIHLTLGRPAEALADIDPSWLEGSFTHSEELLELPSAD
jgi:two-component system probable response regulator PhcQ